ncbi:MAG: hypothetical protein ACOYN0_16400, partial [Phycisphaerales bacterium]
MTSDNGERDPLVEQRAMRVAAELLGCPADQRESLMRTLVGADASLESRVRALLDAEPFIDGFLETPHGPSRSRLVAEGAVVAGWVIGELLGAGSTSEVYAAVRATDSQTAALKVFRVPAASGRHSSRTEDEIAT